MVERIKSFLPFTLDFKGKPVTVRKAVLRDVAALTELHNHPKVMEPDLMEPGSVTAEAVTESIARPDAIHLVAEHGGRIVGTIFFRPQRGGGSDVSRFSIAFHPDFHRTGMPASVFNEVLAKLREKGFKTILGSVYDSNAAARKFYQKLGFQETVNAYSRRNEAPVRMIWKDL